MDTNSNHRPLAIITDIPPLSTTSRSSGLAPTSAHLRSPISANATSSSSAASAISPASVASTAFSQNQLGNTGGTGTITNESGGEQVLVHKEVDVDALQRGRSLRRRRKFGAVPYPLKFSKHLRDFDSLDLAFVMSVMNGSLSIQGEITPPTRVLDLGTGGGLWIIEAASHWKNTTFVGLDIAKCQPDLRSIGLDDVADRIEWIHANFLEPLPFQDGEFDFVRMQLVGMGVPEDEWQSLIQEIARVLKPDGTFECVEEDIIFPCPATPITSKAPHISPPHHHSSRKHSLSVSAPLRTLNLHNGLSDQDDSDSDSTSTIGDTLRDFFDLDSDQTEDEDPDADGTQDQRDHTRLKEAFMQMLSRRFINPRVLTVLPFYLEATFSEVQCAPTIRIFLPPPSNVPFSPDAKAAVVGSDGDITQPLREDFSASTTTFSTITTASSTSTSSNTASTNSSVATAFTDPLMTVTPMPTALPASLASRRRDDWSQNFDHSRALLAVNMTNVRMGISRLIEIVRTSREALFEEYERLYKRERAVPNERMDRDDFDALLYNWECDMQDRCQMREGIASSLDWPIPAMLSKPFWQEWREKGDADDVLAFYASARPEPVRAIRGFVCKRPC